MSKRRKHRNKLHFKEPPARTFVRRSNQPLPVTAGNENAISSQTRKEELNRPQRNGMVRERDTSSRTDVLSHRERRHQDKSGTGLSASNGSGRVRRSVDSSILHVSAPESESPPSNIMYRYQTRMAVNPMCQTTFNPRNNETATSTRTDDVTYQMLHGGSVIKSSWIYKYNTLPAGKWEISININDIRTYGEIVNSFGKLNDEYTQQSLHIGCLGINRSITASQLQPKGLVPYGIHQGDTPSYTDVIKTVSIPPKLIEPPLIETRLLKSGNTDYLSTLFFEPSNAKVKQPKQNTFLTVKAEGKSNDQAHALLPDTSSPPCSNPQEKARRRNTSESELAEENEQHHTD